MMTVFSKSGFEVIHPSAKELIVVAHPQYWLVAITLGMILLGIYFGIAGLKKGTYSGSGVGAFLLLLGVVLLSVALGRGQALFDKNQGRVSFDRTGFLFRSQHLSFPLDQVRYASVETMQGSYRFVVVFKGGGREAVTSGSGASGQYAAADAVNEFLGVFPERP
jgi:hypothetical protein